MKRLKFEEKEVAKSHLITLTFIYKNMENPALLKLYAEYSFTLQFWCIESGPGLHIFKYGPTYVGMFFPSGIMSQLFASNEDIS